MNKAELLKRLASELSEHVDAINSGGCAVMAYIVSRKLSDCKIKVSFSLADECAEPMNELEKRYGDSLRDWNRNGIYFGHVFIELIIDGLRYFWDSNGLIEAKDFAPSYGFPLYKGEISKQKIKKIAGNASGWNCTFDRRDIRKLYQITEKVFAEAKGV